MNPRVGELTWWARQVLLTAGAVLGVVCALVTVGALLFGLRPLVFESGSMSPTIDTGDLAISHQVQADSLREGQIVSVPAGDGTRVTHRVVSVEHDHGQAVLVLRGDANEVDDATPYRVGEADVVLLHVPRLGYAVGWLSSPVGLFLLGLYAAFLVSVLVKGAPQRGPGSGAITLSSEPRVVPPTRGRRAARRRRVRRRSVLGGGLGVVLALGGVAGATAAREITPTMATFTDSVVVSGADLTAASVPAPTLSCSWGLFQRTFTWTAVPGATGYSFYADRGADPIQVSGTSYTETPGNRRYASVVAQFGTWSSPRSNEVSYQLLGSPC
ncbi:signal peptidase I [Nocardioides sp. CGMCC 1.13656]|uniref:signal peptidase I n=1 Tax=Nocardioides TaxID=1839 RepID=UPI0012F8CAB8|nr:signal peptidase I [Nocardioides sp. CGMCC 1.13656]MBA2953066.1 signal peptidase I [Nocardioides sp. CGMCC 1.13656]